MLSAVSEGPDNQSNPLYDCVISLMEMQERCHRHMTSADVFFVVLQSANPVTQSPLLVANECTERKMGREFAYWYAYRDRLCGLVLRLPGYRPRGPGFDSRCYQIFEVAMGLERGPLSPCEDK
jgi:hypothetical protein